jgi:hypothetical protein
MIQSAEEFYRLRTSDNPQEYNRAAAEEAPLIVWRQVIEQYPEMKQWVAHNKTVPIEILETLSRDPDVAVRSMVAMKRKLTEEIQIRLATDAAYSVRHQLVHNAKATERVLKMLAEDKEEGIGKRAKEKLKNKESR